MANRANGSASREAMPITPEFLESVTALELTRSPTDSVAGGIALVVPRPMALPGSTAPFLASDRLTLVQRGSPRVTLVATRERLAKALTAVHGTSAFGAELARDVASILLGIATLLPAHDRLAALNDLLEHAASARVASWLVLPEPEASADLYRIGDFTYGRVDAERMRASWERAGADDWAKHRPLLAGQRAIWRTREVVLVDPYRFGDRRQGSAEDGRILFALMDAFFRRMAAEEHSTFGEDLDRAQRVVRAAGLGGIPRDSFLQLGGFGMRVTAFTRDVKRRGWIVPQGVAPLLQTVSPGALRDGAASIINALALDDWNSRPLDPVIERFAQYVVRARDDLDGHDPASSVLHLIFGLDYLLGGSREQPLTATLASRVAMLASRACGQAAADVEKRVTELYDARSGYAHRGTMDGVVDTSAREVLFRFAFACLGAAFHARRQEWAGPDFKSARDAWLGRIDLAAQQARVRGDADDLALADLGVTRIELVDTGACRVRLR